VSSRRDHRTRPDGTACPDPAGCVRLHHPRLEVDSQCGCCGELVAEQVLPADDGHRCRVLGRAGLAELLGIHTASVTRMVHRGELPAPQHLDDGGIPYWYETDIMTFLAKGGRGSG
jgi:hypothetical protein